MSYVWVRKDVILAVHNMQISEYGGGLGVRDEGLLDSALLRPVNQQLYSSINIYAVAAAYAYGLIKNHPFIDGNKRTALVASLLFLRINGCLLRIDEDMLYSLINGLAAGSISENELANAYEMHCKF